MFTWLSTILYQLQRVPHQKRLELQSLRSIDLELDGFFAGPFATAEHRAPPIESLLNANFNCIDRTGGLRRDKMHSGSSTQRTSDTGYCIPVSLEIKARDHMHNRSPCVGPPRGLSHNPSLARACRRNWFNMEYCNFTSGLSFGLFGCERFVLFPDAPSFHCRTLEVTKTPGS